MKIAIASGKGGTGKTTLATNLALLINKNKSLVFADLDVEEPNSKIFLNPIIDNSRDISLLFPQINKEQCAFCGKCSDACQFNALAILKNDYIFFPELCHSCGRCFLVCPHNAIIEKQSKIGIRLKGKKKNIQYYEGLLDEGKVQTKSMIAIIKKEMASNQLEIRDCPPGTTCPMVECVKDANYVILVTEPTPFGLNDLSIAADSVKKMEIPLGVVINKSCENDIIIERYCEKNNLNIIGKLPYSRVAATKIANGHLLLDTPKYKKALNKIINFFKKMEF